MGFYFFILLWIFCCFVEDMLMFLIEVDSFLLFFLFEIIFDVFVIVFDFVKEVIFRLEIEGFFCIIWFGSCCLVVFVVLVVFLVVRCVFLCEVNVKFLIVLLMNVGLVRLIIGCSII